MNVGDIQTRRIRKRDAIKLAAADAEHGLRKRNARQRFVERSHDFGALRRVTEPTRHDNVLAPRQRTGQRFPGLATHDHRVAHRARLEAAQVFGQAPGQAVAGADDAVVSNGDDEGKLAVHLVREFKRRSPGHDICRKPPRTGGSVIIDGL